MAVTTSVAEAGVAAASGALPVSPLPVPPLPVPLLPVPTLHSLPLPAPAVPDVPQASGFWIQLGAFRQRDGAEDFQRRVAAELDWLAERLGVFSDAPLFRLQAGPYASRDEARGAAERIRLALQLVPVVLERH